MSQGGVTNKVTSGSGSAAGSASRAARTVILLGVTPSGTVNALYNISSPAAIKSALDVSILGEMAAKLLQHGAANVYCVPLNPSTAGGLSASVTQAGNGVGTVTPACAPHRAITVKCSTGGTIGTAAFQFSLDGGVTYSAPVVSVASAPWTYMVPGTFCTLSFAAATYVATKTNTIGTDGTVTPGAAWVGVVTQVSSPLDDYDIVVNVSKAGALGVATIQVSLDGNNSTLPTMPVPSGGVVVIPGTGIYLTLASTFVLGDTYSFLAVKPTYSTSDLTNAINAIAAMTQSSPTPSPTVALLHAVGTPASAAGAISQASTMDAAIAAARSSYGKQWIGICECPCSEGGLGGDTVLSGGNAALDTADTSTVIRTARVGQTFNYTSVPVGQHRQQSALGSYKLKRPTGWMLVQRYVEADPSSDLSEVARGGLDVFAIGRDEATASVTLYDAQFNTLTTYSNQVGAYLTIESGGVGWRNMTVDPNFQDANAVRVLCVFLAAVTAAAQRYLGSRQTTNANGTIAESARQPITSDLDSTAKKAVGLAIGSPFNEPQASSASAQVLASSQLGTAPKRMDVQYVLQSLGFVSSVGQNTAFSGIIPVTQ